MGDVISIITSIIDIAMFSICCFFAIMGTIKSLKKGNNWVTIFCICMAFFTGYGALTTLFATFLSPLSTVVDVFWYMAQSLTWWLLAYLY